uniref:MFS domain-containing protein n=1 Tax=Macrostomum lignano TaxID=282301 RepID=A0A1I8F440_9PLAT
GGKESRLLRLAATAARQITGVDKWLRPEQQQQSRAADICSLESLRKAEKNREEAAAAPECPAAPCLKLPTSRTVRRTLRQPEGHHVDARSGRSSRRSRRSRSRCCRWPRPRYAWVVMLASMCNNFIIDGIANTYCELLVDFIEYFADAPKSSLSLIGSLLCGVYLISGPVAGGLVNKFGCRVTCVLAPLSPAWPSWPAASPGPSPQLTLLYGVAGGIGLGLMYLPSIVIWAGGVRHGHRHHGDGPVVRLLLEHYGWQNCLMILAGVTLNGAVFGCLMPPLTLPRSRADETDGAAAASPTRPRPDNRSRNDAAGGSKNVSNLCKKYIKNTAAPSNGTADTEAEDPRLRSNSDSGTIRFKRNKVRQPSKSRVVAAAAAPGNFMGSTPDMLPEIRCGREPDQRRGRLRCGAGGPPHQPQPPAGRSAGRSTRKDIFLGSSIFDLAQNDPRMKRSLKDVSQADLYLSMTRLPQADPRVRRRQPAEGALSYLIIFAANMVGMIAFYIPGFFISDFAKETGVPAALTPTLISAYGAANTLARVAFGFLAGQKHFSPLAINNVTILITGVCVALLVVCHNYVSMVTVFALFGFFSGPYISLTSVILLPADRLGECHPAASACWCWRGECPQLRPAIGGCLYTEASGYLVPFLVSGALFCLCGLMHSLLHLPRFRRREAENTEDIVRSLQSLASSRPHLQALQHQTYQQLMQPPQMQGAWCAA